MHWYWVNTSLKAVYMLFAGWEEGGPATKCCRHGGAWKESGKYANCQLKVWRTDDEDYTTFLKYGELCKLSIQGKVCWEWSKCWNHYYFVSNKFGQISAIWWERKEKICKSQMIKNTPRTKMIFLDTMQRLADTERLMVVILINWAPAGKENMRAWRHWRRPRWLQPPTQGLLKQNHAYPSLGVILKRINNIDITTNLW